MSGLQALLTMLLAGLAAVFLMFVLLAGEHPEAAQAVRSAPAVTPIPTPTPTPKPTPKPTPTPTPLRKRTELLVLVNPWHKMAEGYEPALRQVTWGYGDDDQFLDERAADDMIQMIADCSAAGNHPFVCSAYRNTAMQEYLFNNKIARLVYEEGVDPGDAPEVAATTVALPGTSEHQLGLAADIIDYNYPYLNEQQEEMPTQKWLMEHCWDYGFILRYPNDKSEITGIIYEPWHYRYVGHEAAREIRDLGLTLEEYLDRFYEPLE